MTILELFYSVDRVSDLESYKKEYQYYSVNDNNEYILLNLKDNSNMFCDTNLGTEDGKFDIIEILMDYVSHRVKYPCFIPYPAISRLEKIYIEFEDKVSYESSFKYPLICVRGTCDKECTTEKLPYLYCFENIPCMGKRPDCNCWTGKWPDFYDMITDVVRWMEVCRHMDALVVMFEYPPNPSSLSESCLRFDFSTGLLIKDNHITVLSDSKVRTLYEEYNKKYPTMDRDIEEDINWAYDSDCGFKYEFRF